jgi:hypothetical protein
LGGPKLGGRAYLVASLTSRNCTLFSSMDALASPIQLLREIVLRAIAYRVDSYCRNRTLEPPYGKRGFFLLQNPRSVKSTFLSLPTEIRLLIYSYVLDPSLRSSQNWSKMHPILSSCRLMYQEAIVMALQRTRFRFGYRLLTIRTSVRALQTQNGSRRSNALTTTP